MGGGNVQIIGGYFVGAKWWSNEYCANSLNAPQAITKQIKKFVCQTSERGLCKCPSNNVRERYPRTDM